MPPFVSHSKFKQLEKEMSRDLSKIEHQYEKATWYAKRHAMAFGADEDKLRTAIFEYYRKRELQLDYHERILRKKWDWASLEYW